MVCGISGKQNGKNHGETSEEHASASVITNETANRPHTKRSEIGPDKKHEEAACGYHPKSGVELEPETNLKKTGIPLV
jgi:hypothetical protein